MFFLVAVSSARADGDEGRQVPGTDACTCSPPDFTFTLNFGGTCDTSDVVPSDGIERVRCIVSDEVFQPVDDEVPTVIDQIDILEFGLNLTLLSETAYLGPYNDGDMFDFTRYVLCVAVLTCVVFRHSRHTLPSLVIPALSVLLNMMEKMSHKSFKSPSLDEMRRTTL